MDTLVSALLVVLAIVILAYYAKKVWWTPIIPPPWKPIGPPAPAGLTRTYPIYAAYCNVPTLRSESLGTMILEVKGVPPDTLSGCSAHLSSAPGHPPLEGWNDPPLFLAEILPHASAVAGGAATLYLRPAINGVIQGDVSLAGNPLGYVTLRVCHR